MAAKKELVSVRILTGFLLEGVNYAAGQLVALPPALAEQLASAGSVDPHKDALAFCKAEGLELVEHAPVGPDAEAEE